MKIINLTPHAIHFMDKEGSVLTTIQPSGTVARAKQTCVQVGIMSVGEANIPINQSSYGEVEGLPAPEDGTVYIVSALTAQAVPDRNDVFITDDAVRDAEGRIIGCRALAHI